MVLNWSVPNDPHTAFPELAGQAATRKYFSRALLAGLLGLTVSVMMYWLLDRQENGRDVAELKRQVATYLAAVQEHRNGSEDLLRTLRALFFQNPKLGRQLFSNAVQDLAIRMDGMQAIGWAPRVTSAGRAEFEAAARKVGFAGFKIVEGDLTHQPEEKPETASNRPEYFPLLFVEPMAGNELALGYDLAWPPPIRDLLSRTHNVGETEVSGPVRLPYKHSVKIGVLAAMPVYHPDFAPPSREERLRQNQGYVVAVFVVDELIRAINARAPELQLDVMLLDVTESGATSVMGVSLQGQASPQPEQYDPKQFLSRKHFSQPLDVGGRKLIWEFRRSAKWNRGLGHWVPFSALCFGLLLTGILVQAIHAAGAKSCQIEATVHVRTAELAQANAKLKAEVGDRIAAQDQLARERNLLFTLLNRLPDAVCVTDRQGHYVLANEAQARLVQETGAHNLFGKSVGQVGPPALAETLAMGAEEVIRSGKAILGQEHTVTLPADQRMSLELSKLPLRDAHGAVDGLLVISRDVTQLKREEAEKREFSRRLEETQKLESLGILAGGIAHDFNNLLTVILGNANLARMDVPEPSKARECLRRIETTSLRAAELCKQMLAYSGKGIFVVRRLDLSRLVEETAELLQLSISKKARLELHLGRDLPPVLVDATQLQQILMNLVINASDAIETRDGVIQIRSGLMHIDQAAVRAFSPPTNLPDGEYVFLEVSDNGCGMAPEVRDRIFDPFFSTKFTGRGLGLAAVLGIVRGHRGAITVQSKLGQGSSFKLLLPAVEGPLDEPAELVGPSTTWKGHGTILLAEDEEAVRATTSSLLKAGGFQVDSAENGQAALQTFRVAPDRYQVVLLDLTMPNGDGEETFHEIRRLRPHIPVLMMSGFSPQAVLDRFAGKGLNGFIQKPFLAEDLVAAIRKILDGSPHRGR